jgi:hypothetical protein
LDAKAGKGHVDRNAVDPKTGKPMYKMGLGQKLLGTASNFLTGFGGGKTQPVCVGPGATNSRFDRDETTREANVARDTTALGEQDKLDTTNQLGTPRISSRRNQSCPDDVEVAPPKQYLDRRLTLSMKENI